MFLNKHKYNYKEYTGHIMDKNDSEKLEDDISLPV